ncbi:undecaprenyldiphospho-muramoylpentapeptide beta-N-acetylglucosaminyltransferase [Aquimarina agarilytica]|uniref:undecaprenyldiphospho-muramoylpentapeptide beta-N-acetylglucosaminyltransferase n=1 Tax=Aquimarina agarilytica TaxID=1087449 RepID=UPI00028813BB|nr:undecaprenyldiphospho-muramoylpentapeptide beta-N-acetylglucosaminyltransferase [Aquimarina agarilytica]
MRQLSFVISGGGTGGHIYPAIAIADALKQKYPEANFLFVGASDRMEMQKVPKAGYEIEGLWISGIQRKLSTKNLLLPFKLVSSLWKSYKIIKKQKPTIAIGTGGYASAALLKMAGWMQVPTLIQEQNSFPGITNKWLAGNAKKICVAYPDLERFFPAEKLVQTGNPVRQDILNKDISSAEAFNYFELNEGVKTILVLGGSLGAKAINELVASRIAFFKENNVQVLWQCGQLYYERFKHLATAHIKIVAYIDRMDLAYGMADCIVSRAGASSVSELAIVGKPVLFIPSPYVAEDHQTKNAEAVVKANAACMIKQSEFEAKFDAQILALLHDKALIENLSSNFKKLSKPEATAHIVNEIEKLIKE